MPTEYTSMRSRDGKGIAHDDFEDCSRCGAHLSWKDDVARAEHWAEHEADDGEIAAARAEFKRAELHRMHYCSTCMDQYAIDPERLAQAIHETMGGDPNFGMDGECECRESADFLIRAYNDPTLGARYGDMLISQQHRDEA